ncbi:MAG: alkaline phosphatase PhoX [Gemmatimonadales bacterium]
MKSALWLGAAASVALAACSADGTPGPDAESSEFPEPGLALHYVRPGESLPFTPVAASAACVPGGGAEQIVLPTGFNPLLIATEGAGFPDLPDMITVNETGRRQGRFLYRTHETGSNGAVSVTDLVTGVTSILAQRADWERFDGIAWSPWGTVIAAEETSGSALKDPEAPLAVGGHVYEIDPETGAASLRAAVGARSHEGLRFDKRGWLYGISETGPGYIYRFVPDRHGRLSSGKLYALRITDDQGDRTGTAEWVLLDGPASELNSLAEAGAKGATGYSRPEDVEIGTSTGSDQRGNDIMYVAITGENRVLAIDLNNGRTSGLVVSDYVRAGVNAPLDFTAPDNLALDRSGNLYITEDPGGTAATGKTLGDDVWFAPFNPTSATQAADAVRFFTITDCDAEPTGIYLSPSGKTLFVNVQHRGGSDPRDQTWGIQRLGDVDFTRAGN